MMEVRRGVVGREWEERKISSRSDGKAEGMQKQEECVAAKGKGNKNGSYSLFSPFIFSIHLFVNFVAMIAIFTLIVIVYICIIL